MSCEPFDRTAEPIAHLHTIAQAAGWTIRDIQIHGDRLHIFMTVDLPEEPAECRSTNDPRNLANLTPPPLFSPLKPRP